MSKPRKLGMKSAYVPNAKADMRHHKKVYQRGREKACNNPREQQAVVGTKVETCVSCGCVIPEGRLQCPNCEGG